MTISSDAFSLCERRSHTQREVQRRLRCIQGAGSCRKNLCVWRRSLNYENGPRTPNRASKAPDRLISAKRTLFAWKDTRSAKRIDCSDWFGVVGSHRALARRFLLVLPSPSFAPITTALMNDIQLYSEPLTSRAADDGNGDEGTERHSSGARASVAPEHVATVAEILARAQQSITAAQSCEGRSLCTPGRVSAGEFTPRARSRRGKCSNRFGNARRVGAREMWNSAYFHNRSATD